MTFFDVLGFATLTAVALALFGVALRAVAAVRPLPAARVVRVVRLIRRAPSRAGRD